MPSTRPPRSSPLQGVRVLDLSRLLPGPYCSLILAELGADIVKVEDLQTGDYLRHMPPLARDLNGAFCALNRGKRSLAIDLKHPRGCTTFSKLLPHYDVVLESFRPGVLERLGLGFETLRSIHPSVTLCSISGYGQDGPWRDRAGHDINYLALSGVLAAGGTATGGPALPGVQLADLAGGLWATISILATLRSGGGVHLDVSMTEGAMAFLLPWLGDYAVSGTPLRRGEGTLNGGSAAYDTYQTRDGRYLAVGALEPKFWSALCEELALNDDNSDDPSTALAERLRDTIAQENLDTWVERLATTDLCTEPVLEMDELGDHALHRQRQMFFTLQDALRGPLKMLRLPLGPPRATTPPPTHGEHSEEILEEAGLTPQEIRSLREANVIKTP